MAFGDDLDVHPLCALHPCVLNPTLSSICYESKISAFSESVLVDVASPHMQRAAHNHFTHFHFVPGVSITGCPLYSYIQVHKYSC